MATLRAGTPPVATTHWHRHTEKAQTTRAGGMGATMRKDSTQKDPQRSVLKASDP